MAIKFENCMGSQPLTYVREVLSHFDFKKPPIPVEEISDFIGLKIKTVPNPKPNSAEAHELLTRVPCWLDREKHEIQLYERCPRKRKRLGIAHENNHYIIPYHEGLNPFCPEADDPTCRKHTEQEAFLGGAAMMFYPKLFFPDALSFDRIGIGAVEKLSDRYDGSIEATANWYIRTHPKICAVVIAQPFQRKAVQNGDPGTMKLGLDLRHSKRVKNPTPLARLPRKFADYGMNYPLEVKYAIRSHRFPKWIRSGVGIPETSLINQCYQADVRMSGEVPAGDLGSRSPFSYTAECLPFGVNGSRSVMVILTLPDKQQNFGFLTPTLGW